MPEVKYLGSLGPSTGWQYVFRCTGRHKGQQGMSEAPGCGMVHDSNMILCSACGEQYTLHMQIARWVRLPSTWWRPSTWGMYRREFK